jgi:hypothetical protein
MNNPAISDDVLDDKDNSNANYRNGSNESSAWIAFLTLMA